MLLFRGRGGMRMKAEGGMSNVEEKGKTYSARLRHSTFDIRPLTFAPAPALV